jgi:hypothetical protein
LARASGRWLGASPAGRNARLCPGGGAHACSRRAQACCAWGLEGGHCSGGHGGQNRAARSAPGHEHWPPNWGQPGCHLDTGAQSARRPPRPAYRKASTCVQRRREASELHSPMRPVRPRPSSASGPATFVSELAKACRREAHSSTAPARRGACKPRAGPRARPAGCKYRQAVRSVRSLARQAPAGLRDPSRALFQCAGVPSAARCPGRSALPSCAPVKRAGQTREAAVSPGAPRPRSCVTKHASGSRCCTRVRRVPHHATL